MLNPRVSPTLQLNLASILFLCFFPSSVFCQQPNLTQAPDRKFDASKLPSVKSSNGPIIPGLEQGAVRQNVQGMCVHNDLVFLSVSYGRANRSRIVVYRNPIGGAAHKTITLKNKRVIPLWFLDGENYLDEIDFPPMSEGIAMVGDRLAVLSESGAKKYQRFGKGPLDHILLLDVSSFTKPNSIAPKHATTENR